MKKPWIHGIGMVFIVAMASLALTVPAAQWPPDPPCQFSVGPDHANCCACNIPRCMEVEHQGVASCTFEFCSKTKCTIGPS